jgi:hypothetical protein
MEGRREEKSMMFTVKDRHVLVDGGGCGSSEAAGRRISLFFILYSH